MIPQLTHEFLTDSKSRQVLSLLLKRLASREIGSAFRLFQVCRELRSRLVAVAIFLPF
jgi:hypothetical protein